MTYVSKILNVLLVFASLTFLYASWIYFTLNEKHTYALNEIHDQIVKTNQLIGLAEKISSLNDYKPNNDLQNTLVKNSAKNTIEQEIAGLNQRRGKLYSYTEHTSFYVDSYYIFQDMFSKKLYFGTPDDIRIKAEVNELFINNKAFKWNEEGKYTLLNNGNFTFKLNKYTLDYCNLKIDTSLAVRSIQLPQ